MTVILYRFTSVNNHGNWKIFWWYSYPRKTHRSRDCISILKKNQEWLGRRRIKINVTKSQHVISTISVCFHQQRTKFRSNHHSIDRKLHWKNHVLKKRKQIDIKYKDVRRLLDRKSKLPLENKLLGYKTIILPIWIIRKKNSRRNRTWRQV